MQKPAATKPREKFDQEFLDATKEGARRKANEWLRRVLGSENAAHDEVSGLKPDPKRPGESMAWIRVFGYLPEDA